MCSFTLPNIYDIALHNAKVVAQFNLDLILTLWIKKGKNTNVSVESLE